jgi:hypothetical protein
VAARVPADRTHLSIHRSPSSPSLSGLGAVAPELVYADFAGVGRDWMSPDGPYNEYLLVTLGMAVSPFGTMALIALFIGSVWLARATGLAAAIANVLHKIYYQIHLSLLPTTTGQILRRCSLSRSPHGSRGGQACKAHGHVGATAACTPTQAAGNCAVSPRSRRPTRRACVFVIMALA